MHPSIRNKESAGTINAEILFLVLGSTCNSWCRGQHKPHSSLLTCCIDDEARLTSSSCRAALNAQPQYLALQCAVVWCKLHRVGFQGSKSGKRDEVASSLSLLKLL